MSLCKLDGKLNGVYVLTLNSHNRVNSLTNDFLTQLTDCMKLLKREADVKTLIIRSAISGTFCAGADLKERLSMNENEVRETLRRIRSVAEDIYNFAVPTIAAIDGAAVGGGLEYALASDIRVASSDAKLGLVETSLATIPGSVGDQLLSRLIPVHLAKELIFTARMMSGKEAFDYGLLNYVVEQNSYGNASFCKALELAQFIVENLTLSVRMSKVSINKGRDVDLKNGLAIESNSYEVILHTKDRVERLNAFVQNKKLGK